MGTAAGPLPHLSEIWTDLAAPCSRRPRCSARLRSRLRGFRQRVHFEAIDSRILEQGRRIVFLYRDPRDTTVSAWRQTTRRMGIFDGSLSKFLVHPCFGLEKIARYNLFFLNMAGDWPILPVAYETMQANPAAEVRRVCAFLDRACDPEAITLAVETHSFSRMQERELSGQIKPEHAHILGARIDGDANSLKVRRGRIGGSSTSFPAATMRLAPRFSRASTILRK
ncbi:MAG: sulfotransferase domain-containing protein [Dongiaceae bacterium]